MPRALLLLLLLAPGTSALGSVPAAPGDDAGAAARALLAELAEQIPPRALPGVSCQDVLPEALPRFAGLPPAPRALVRATMALALSGAACGAEAETEVLKLFQELGAPKAVALLRGLARLQAAPTPQPFASLLLSLARAGGSVPAWLCAAPTRLRAPMAGTNPSLLGVPTTGHSAEGIQGRVPRAWLAACRHAQRHRSRRRREEDDACDPPGERQAHEVLEWVPGVSIFYNLGTSLYYAFQGCQAVASTRALEAAEDLGYTGLAAVTGAIGGPVALGVQLGMQPGLKAGVRALIHYLTSSGDPPPVPTAHSGSVLFIE
ncbi:apolipoprotein F [Dryobates pubescens]|uniref:apolipoprotein F n=1 Tax=Dryobates pubescens TaxID=118200 RepID=UPI0023B9F59B|nr:apolipoprotein F [Dryobates pubescens]